jgi:hypothetical protein
VDGFSGDKIRPVSKRYPIVQNVNNRNKYFT